jgi:hypothetical protein
MNRLLCLAGLAAALSGCYADAASGTPAMDFTLEEADGSIVSLSSYRGRGILLTFFGLG